MKIENRKSKPEAKPKREDRRCEGGARHSLPLDQFAVGYGNEEAEVQFWGVTETDWVLREEAAKPRDLLERTARFGEQIVLLAKKIPKGTVNDPLISQLVRAGTSVGANYSEADDPLSRKDYLKSIGICRKESKETQFWLRTIASSEPALKDSARPLWKEAKELNLIFGSIYRKR